MSTKTGAQIRKAIRKQTMLDALEDGPQTSEELAEATGIPHRTVQKYVRQLREEGRVDTDGTAPSTGGSPRTLYVLDAEADR